MANCVSYSVVYSSFGDLSPFLSAVVLIPSSLGIRFFFLNQYFPYSSVSCFNSMLGINLDSAPDGFGKSTTEVGSLLLRITNPYFKSAIFRIYSNNQFSKMLRIFEIKVFENFWLYGIFFNYIYFWFTRCSNTHHSSL